MNFFEHQAQAHRESKKLLFLFVLAVIAIVVAVNGTLALLWLWSKGMHAAGSFTYPRGFFLTNTAVTLLFIVGGTLFEMARLKDGGDAVAQMAGGRLVQPDSRDIQERRLLNIVEEMALAAGIACPRVYVMDEEDAINAFAAGYHQNEAVVAVTRGTLSRLSRDELQGVIGHEFSHILNGDMRMNVKLIGVLFGIQMLASLGQHLMEWGARMGGSRSRDEKGPSLQLMMILLGVALFVIGYIGIFFGRLIKSAVSRQREFLADASAVQFTRNPDGIGGALRKIGGLTRENKCGSRIKNPNAEQLSHMFLGAARPNLLSGLFATHPPIATRLQRLYGRNVELLDAGELPPEIDEAAAMGAAVAGFAPNSAKAQMPAAIAVSTTSFHPEYGYQTAKSSVDMPFANKLSVPATASITRPVAASIPSEIVQAARDPKAASALVYALLLDRSDAASFQIQLDILRQAIPAQCALVSLLHEMTETMSASMRLPVLDLATPALKLLSAEQAQQLLGIAARLIAADQVVTQAEFVLQTVLQRRLSSQAGRDVKVKYAGLHQLPAETALLVSLMASTEFGLEQAEQRFQTALDSMPELSLGAARFVPLAKVDYFEVKQALDKLQQLAPLAKPFLIRLMLKASGKELSTAGADLLRSVCAALDAPVPEVVSASYTSVPAL
ncbi:M48 family metallopeptidase [Undibacterium flavidum]|uniref:M48 family metallopeptidase n=1 Tax=Undibacterium flavidum TaxID=2762297 RepID=A0ABR6Y8X4_9BURK|nr:M48 family metallopeptidase [Undibacterium flavidum]MBC3873029.1 M48 family metallopeptidase [Undibacterium flavidum]